jgi:hypothetical protein
MDVKEIPLLVFDEMSKEFGLEHEDTVCYHLRDYRVRELKDGGLIAYAEDPGYPNSDLKSKSVHFEIWHHLPSEFHDYPSVLEIVACPIFMGTWIRGSGKKIKEDMVANFSRYPLRLDNSLVPVISSALLFAQTMALSSDCQRDEYFEIERCPEGNYNYSNI